ncbi:outer membrane beta-barrel protein [Flavobacterium phragmitis]|uniref:Outer membrane protein beta-barrel domain-containing protein n=1 Tax=Flavobacterium phragmitis TaxID=739143 RepID=A0A1I1LRJ4_9FLAO|nr:outer membrane beta-barrel protein [Flavobacterium phragmitis]SFC75721.1 Outer membrane protein beta-barrel domain-containing protein [Flavobacterium phragmitis]
MKNLFTIIAAFFSILAVYGQQQEIDDEMDSAKGITFKSGDMFIEGSIKISTGGDQDFYAFSPKFGYLLGDKFAIGAKLDYSSNKIESTGTKTNVFGIGGFARYYFLELDKKRFKSYAEAGLGYGRNKVETPVLGSNTDNSITADINIGLNYFVTRNIAVTFILANVLSFNSVSPENGPSSDTFQLNINLFENIFDQPQFGLLYRF